MDHRDLTPKIDSTLNQFGSYAAVKDHRDHLVVKEDAIALACAVHRKWLENPTGTNRWCPLDSVGTMPVDHLQSVLIKKYYNARLGMEAWTKLSSQSNSTFSEFRQKLYSLVNDKLSITNQDIGIVYRLPYFYAEDCALDEIVESTSNANVFYKDYHNHSGEFMLIKRIIKSRKSNELVQFWFKYYNNSSAFAVSVPLSCPTLGIVDELFKKKIIRLTTDIAPVCFYGNHRDRWYYKMFNVRLA